MSLNITSIYVPHSRDILTLLHANNKVADQPAHPRSLVSTFVIRFLESIITQLNSCNVLLLQLVSVAGRTGLSLTWLQNPRYEAYISTVASVNDQK